MTLINNSYFLQITCILHWILDKKRKNVISGKKHSDTGVYVPWCNVLSQFSFPSSELFQSSVWVPKPSFSSLYLSSAYPRGYDWISDRITLFLCALWGLNYQQNTALRNLYSCESEMTFSKTDWRLQQGSEVDLELWTKFFHFDLLWHLSLRCASIHDTVWQQGFMPFLNKCKSWFHPVINILWRICADS